MQTENEGIARNAIKLAIADGVGINRATNSAIAELMKLGVGKGEATSIACIIANRDFE